MPIMDGLTSSRTIRTFETTHPSAPISPRAALNGRIPIIVVSATLNESERRKYVEGGFDAWILKPINFARLQDLMRGMVDPETRRAALYQPGAWEQGGWFGMAGEDAGEAVLSPMER